MRWPRDGRDALRVRSPREAARSQPRRPRRACGFAPAVNVVVCVLVSYRRWPRMPVGAAGSWQPCHL